LIGRSSTTRLQLLCHASTSAVRTSAFPADEAIDSQKRQVLSVTQRHFVRSDRCLTSPALRARQTAEALLLDATVEPALRDCDYGRWAGFSFDHVQTKEPAALADWLCDPAAAPHGGEAILSLMERVGAWLDAQSGIRSHARFSYPCSHCLRDRRAAAIVLAHRHRTAINHELERHKRSLEFSIRQLHTVKHNAQSF
jgi:hypothetical protein